MEVKPLVSIIIPMYNVGPYISKCIESILHQSYHNLQIIVINDGSTDDSFEKVLCFKEKDNRITLINKNNTGVSATRNIGLNLADGEYLMFVDGDDWINSNMIEYLLNLIKKENSDISCCSLVFEDEKSTGKRYIDSNFSPRILRGSGILSAYLKGFHLWSSSCARLYKTSFLRTNKFSFNETLAIGEDGYFSLQVMAMADSVVISGEPFYHALVRSISTTRSSIIEMKDNENYRLYEDYIVSKRLWSSHENDFKAWYVRAMSSNLFHLALKVSYKEYRQYYNDKILNSKYLIYNIVFVRRMLNLRNHIIALLGKSVFLSYYSMYLFKQIRKKVLA